MSNALGSLLAAALVVVLVIGVESGRADEPETRSIQLHVVDDALPDIDAPIRVSRGDAVMLRFTADRRTDIHVHGYDLKALVEPGATAELSFVARATGRFPITTHGPGGAHVTLQYLEVHPR
jgi:hypothetical protein